MLSKYKLWKAKLAKRRKERDRARKRYKRFAQLVLEARKMVTKFKPLPLRLRAYNEAKRMVGVMEHGGNNRGDKVEEIIRYAQGIVPEPWCVDFLIWCYGKAGSKQVRPGYTRAVRFMLSNGVVHSNEPKKGQMVRFVFDHTGMFVAWCDDAGNVVPRAQATHIKTIEGNTGSSGAVSDSSTGGDGVYEKVRHRSLVKDFLKATG